MLPSSVQVQCTPAAEVSGGPREGDEWFDSCMEPEIDDEPGPSWTAYKSLVWFLISPAGGHAPRSGHCGVCASGLNKN